MGLRRFMNTSPACLGRVKSCLGMKASFTRPGLLPWISIDRFYSRRRQRSTSPITRTGHSFPILAGSFGQPGQLSQGRAPNRISVTSRAKPESEASIMVTSYAATKILVTGADGFIGSHLTEALVSADAQVTALAQYNSFDSHGWLDDLPEPLRGRVNIVRGDVRDAAFISRLVHGHEIVFHLAALIAIPHSYVAPQSYVETNVLGTLNVLEAARQHGAERVVHTSTSEVYGTALTMPIDESHPLQGQSPYSASKIAADMMAEAFARS